MPFRHIPPGQFNLDTLRLMQTAFDDVCQRLNLNEIDPRRSKLATVLMNLAADGELSQLSERAEKALR
jgi:hypothetical protein